MMEAGTGRDHLKRQAAIRAVEEVRDGMVVGLGTGSTAAFAIEALAARVAAGLQVVCIPTSEKTAALARQVALPLTDFRHHPVIDLTIDGADQVEPHTLHLIKGGGGALLREKIVAAASRRLLVIVDETKLADRLGDPVLLPVEVVPFGHEALVPRLRKIGLVPQLRVEEGRPFATDGGHYILDCRCGRIEDAAALESSLAQMVGVVESGLFVNLASTVMIGRSQEVEIVSAPG
ncbi:MAG TPA: ribose-5-phosphate isomerase RpiA [Dongiaceae bacterium]|nr:ribose-5-phosphate isomerase RpiA [Dongiaceae bacterium]